MVREMVIGVDMGGTHLRTALVDRGGNIVFRRKTGTAAALGDLETRERLLHECAAMRNEALKAGGRLMAVGLGVAGKVDSAAGRVLFSPNLRALDGQALAPELSGSLGVPVFMENDANVFGIAEARAGAGRGIENWAGIILGTGIGGCLILQGRLWTGDGLGFVAETGHFIVDPAGPPCICGLKGCLEAHASGRSLREGVEEAAARGTLGPGFLRDRWESGTLDARIVYAAAQKGDPTAGKLFHRMGWALGLAAANLFTVLGIRTVIIGGGVAAAWDQFIGPLKESLARHSCMLDPAQTQVLPSVLGDDAGPLGAGFLAWDLLEKPNPR